MYFKTVYFLSIAIQIKAFLQDSGVRQLQPWIYSIFPISEDIYVNWNFSTHLNLHCFDNELQYKDKHDPQWQKMFTTGKLTAQILKTDFEQCYFFRVRTKFNSNCAEPGKWSDWSSIVKLQNGSIIESCIEKENPSMKNLQELLFLPVVPIIALLIYSIYKIKCIRLSVLPKIPHPRNDFLQGIHELHKEIFSFNEQCENYKIADFEDIYIIEEEEEDNKEDSNNPVNSITTMQLYEQSALLPANTSLINHEEHANFTMNEAMYVTW
ncbi:cytokine receptor common subunit gamma-like [Polypterus senegalus]|uniref:cytokine receptor common subunit gamma-like n=1 Tax=Polypterus senegalus TaxID=55291 RepID=UPI0019642325|nr:cytokine receptor common subunit gamma-like [Polypterus senegalus]